MSLLPGVARSVFEFEENPYRFELVCIELYGEAEGVTLVPTSRTWDLGRDSRRISLLKPQREIGGILCASLSSVVDAKVESDINRLKETTRTTAIVFCSPRPLSEHACDAIEAKIRELYPTAISVTVLGQNQLVALAERYPSIIEKYYAAEVSNIRQALLAEPSTVRDPEQLGLRLALITQTGDDARVLRNELTQHLVLGALCEKSPLTPGQLAVTISSQLHLSRSLSSAYVTEILYQLAPRGLLHFDGHSANITDEGTSMAQAVPDNASTKLLEGRTAVRAAIQQLSGHNLAPEHYNRLWSTLQDGLAELFYSQGLTVARMVGALVSGHRQNPDAKERGFIERLGYRVLPLFSDQAQGIDVRQAVVDMFTERDSGAFAWLSQICSVYLMMCSLGFESLSSQEITSALRNFRLAADTDVLLSLLCPSEDNHEEIKRLISGWKSMGGRLLTGIPSLEEVAYHAWISENDFRAMQLQLSKISDSEAKHLISNVFVRSFRKLSAGSPRNDLWQSYIREFRGDSEWDYGSVSELLYDDFGIELLGSASEDYDEFARRVASFLEERVCELLDCVPDDLDFRARDKCRRDGVLLAAVLAARRTSRRLATEGTVMIFSSARRIKEADDVFRNELGEPDAVISPAALSCLLTLVPGVEMGLGTLRGVLFDIGLGARFSSMERYAYRLLAASEQYSLPWSRRKSLRRELGQKLLEDAKRRDEPIRKIAERVIRSEDPDYSAQKVAEALDKLAVPKEIEKELSELRHEVERLKKELETSKSARRAPVTSKSRPPSRSRKRKK